MSNPKYESTSKTWRRCKCPRCGVLHKYKVFYTGNAKYPPYKCQDHIRPPGDYNELELYGNRRIGG